MLVIMATSREPRTNLEFNMTELELNDEETLVFIYEPLLGMAQFFHKSSSLSAFKNLLYTIWEPSTQIHSPDQTLTVLERYIQSAGSIPPFFIDLVMSSIQTIERSVIGKFEIPCADNVECTVRYAYFPNDPLSLRVKVTTSLSSTVMGAKSYSSNIVLGYGLQDMPRMINRFEIDSSNIDSSKLHELHDELRMIFKETCT